MGSSSRSSSKQQDNRTIVESGALGIAPITISDSAYNNQLGIHVTESGGLSIGQNGTYYNAFSDNAKEVLNNAISAIVGIGTLSTNAIEQANRALSEKLRETEIGNADIFPRVVKLLVIGGVAIAVLRPIVGRVFK